MQGISATTIFTDDLPATKRFYQDVFAAPRVYEDAQSAAFDVANTGAGWLLVCLLTVLFTEGQAAFCSPTARVAWSSPDS